MFVGFYNSKAFAWEFKPVKPNKYARASRICQSLWSTIHLHPPSTFAYPLVFYYLRHIFLPPLLPPARISWSSSFSFTPRLFTFFFLHQFFQRSFLSNFCVAVYLLLMLFLPQPKHFYFSFSIYSFLLWLYTTSSYSFSFSSYSLFYSCSSYYISKI